MRTYKQALHELAAVRFKIKQLAREIADAEKFTEAREKIAEMQILAVQEEEVCKFVTDTIMKDIDERERQFKEGR